MDKHTLLNSCYNASGKKGRRTNSNQARGLGDLNGPIAGSGDMSQTSTIFFSLTFIKIDFIPYHKYR